MASADTKISQLGSYTTPASGDILPISPASGGDTKGITYANLVTNQGLRVYNVKSATYNAKGDGATDDTVAVQAAITAAGGNGIVLFPQGTYLINTATSNQGLSIPSNVILQGVGREVSIIKQGFALNGTGNNWLLGNSDTVNGNKEIVIRDLQITTPVVVGVSPNLTQYGLGLKFQGASDIQIQNCRFLNCMIATYPLPAVINTANVHTTGLNNRWFVTDNYFQDGPEGMAHYQGTDLVFERNHIVNGYDSSFSINSSGERLNINDNIIDKRSNTFAALALIEFTNDSGGDANGIRDVTCNNNTLINSAYNGGKAIQLQIVNNFSCSGNTIRNISVAGVGIYMSGGGNGTIIGNDITTCANHGINIVNDRVITGGLTIVGNNCYNNTTNGINLGGGSSTLDRVAIVGNNCINNGNTGIAASANVTFGIIADNLVNNNTSNQITTGGTGWKVISINATGVGINNNTATTDLDLTGAFKASGNITAGGQLQALSKLLFTQASGTADIQPGSSSYTRILDQAANLLQTFKAGEGSNNAIYKAPGTTFLFSAYTSTDSTTLAWRVDGNGNMSLGPNAVDSKAILDLQSTTLGFLLPRLTTTQRDAITSPTIGLLIFNSTTSKLNVRGASAWEAVTSA